MIGVAAITRILIASIYNNNTQHFNTLTLIFIKNKFFPIKLIFVITNCINNLDKFYIYKNK